MVVCQFFLKGTCRFMEKCKNEHPQPNPKIPFGNRQNSSNNNDGNKGSLPYNASNIANDLNPATEKPMWPLSSYGPSKYEPLLIAGLDESPEELRVKAVLALKAGNMGEYISYESSRTQNANQIIANARTNSDAALELAYKQSNLLNMLAKSNNESPSTSKPTTSVFGTTSAFATTPSAFNNSSSTVPAALAPTNVGTSVFGQPSFGQPSFGQPLAFGQQQQQQQTSVFGQTSAFGQPQNPATNTTSVFGQPSQLGAKPISVFGQPSFSNPTAQSSGSSLIKPASGAFSAFSSGGPSAFGAPQSNPGTSSSGGGGFSAFASQPSSFSAAAANANANPNPLNPPTNPSSGSVFGQPSLTNQAATSTTQTDAFGMPIVTSTNPLNPPATNTNPTNIFGVPQGSQTTSTTGVFGAPSVFGNLGAQQQQQQQQQPQTTSVFGGISAFSTTAPAPTSVFGQSSFSQQQGPSAPSVFNTNPGTNQAQPQTSVFGNAAVSVFGSSTANNKPLSVFGVPSTSTTTTNQPISAFAPIAPSISANMRSVSSSNDIAGATNIDVLLATLKNTKGLYKPGANPYDAALPPDYAEKIPKECVAAFEADKFEFGHVPEWSPPLSVR